MNRSKNRAVGTAALILALTIVLMVSLVSLVQAAVPWTKYLSPLSLLNGANNELYVMDAWVVKNGPNDYQMWYTHGKTGLYISQIAGYLRDILNDNIVNDIADQNLEQLLNDISLLDANARDALWGFLSNISTVIGYATSNNGTDWTVVNSQVLAGGGAGWDSVGFPCVINDGGTYKMWYTHTKTSLTRPEFDSILTDLGSTDQATRKAAILNLTDSTATTIGYTTSADGINWAAETPTTGLDQSGNLWDSVATPCVINDGGTYKMWYTKASTSLTGTDLDNYLANIGTFGSDELWNILDSTSSGIAYATSSDGIGWAETPATGLPSGSGAWDSVGFPCVIKNGSSYEIWYTRGQTDLTLTTFGNLADEIRALAPDLLNLWGDLSPVVNLNDFLTDFTDLVDNRMGNVKTLLADTGTVIGHATSGDGVAWDIQNPTALVGASGSPWSGVGTPCVIYNNGVYEMWYTQGIDALTAQNVVDLLQGNTLPLGYATYEAGVDLVAGWNFVGLPRTPASTTIGDVLADVIGNVDIVWYYDGATDTWSRYIPGGPPPTLNNMTEGKGYWIHVSNPCKLIIDGVEPSLPYDINLVAGWNLISLPETPTSSAIGDVLAGIIGDVEIVWYYDGATDTWSRYIPGGPPPTLTEMTEGKAYWIEMTNPNTLTIDSN